VRKSVFITGARRGLGKETAYKFASNNYDVIINDRLDKDILENIKKDLEEKYSINCLVCFGDISIEKEVIRMLNEVKKFSNKLDVLVNNASIVYDLEIYERNTSIFDETIHNNITGTYLMCKYFGKFMQENSNITRIINISSTNATYNNFPTSIDYDASKAGIISLTHNFAKEFAPNVLVNAIAPGWINTEMNADLDKELVEEESQKIYLKRFAEPKEVASLIYYLGSEENTYIDSEVITIDGGY
jgi:3-oxoacyl-[acyl-carrier protein] reductase